MAENTGLVIPGLTPTTEPTTTQPVTQPATPPSQAGQQQQGSTWNGDINTLPAELRPIYQSMQADYTAKTTEASRIRKEADERYKGLEDKVKRYATDEQNWNSWKPLLGKIDSPEKFNKVMQFLDGRGPSDLRPQQQQADPAQQIQKYLDGVPDDDFVQAQQLNNVLSKYEQNIQTKLMGQFQEQMQQYARSLFQEWGKWNQNFQTLVDQANELKLQHMYGLSPKEGVEFDMNKIMEAAQSYGLTDLNAAYRLAYGEANAQRQAQIAAQQQTAEIEKIKQAEYQRGMQEGRLNQLNTATAFPTPNAMPTFGKTSAAPSNGYSDASKVMLENLLKAGLRG